MNVNVHMGVKVCMCIVSILCKPVKLRKLHIEIPPKVCCCYHHLFVMVTIFILIVYCNNLVSVSHDATRYIFITNYCLQ